MQITSKSPRLTDVTRHLPAPFVNPVFTPYTPFKYPNNSFVLDIVLEIPLTKILRVLVFTIFANISFFKA